MKKRYREVAARIIADLKAGLLKIGDPMPSEAVLCERFGASRSTIRNAMAELEKLGLIERKQGAATRILSTEPTQTYVHSMSAAGDLMQFAGPSWRKVHETTSIVADESLARTLQDRPGRHWVRISQTRHIDTLSAPVGWTDVYLSQDYADIAEEIPTYPGLVYSLLEDRHDVVIHEIRQSIGATPVPRELADILQVEPGDHALELRRNYLDKDGIGQIITLSVLPARHYRYDITLQRRA
ncbi:GntR family transcriptional regulator [Marinovum sp. 2_MG-2023]|uniref:GntR family transcriptional regulator n=1 Tax=unclassified Marinovum TaxID=2647166 RepID=UPI0026E1B07D|nr:MULTISPECIES: GntR family transcriptional regulator [unclassified Marinovum]MDO6731841.1 GntR family transcriptional regulator [Marinovum sp. 2_MG-2023]MDO6781093.1 GntR family transcriptional regulator [Marinovum sp. 1_MG-2023]